MHSYKLAKDWDTTRKIWKSVFLFRERNADEFHFENENERKIIEDAIEARMKGGNSSHALQYWIEKVRKTRTLSEIADVLREYVCECKCREYCGIHSSIQTYSHQSIVAYQQVFQDLQAERRGQSIQAFRNEILAHLAARGS